MQIANTAICRKRDIFSWMPKRHFPFPKNVLIDS
jgi:hypothetical protein